MKESELNEVIQRTIKATTQALQPKITQENHSETHQYVPYRKKCVNCNEGSNPDYKEPNVYCSSCGNPLGTVDEEFSGETDGIKPCINCGGTDGTKLVKGEVWNGWHRTNESDE